MPSLRYACVRCSSTVRVVTNSACATVPVGYAFGSQPADAVLGRRESVDAGDPRVPGPQPQQIQLPQRARDQGVGAAPMGQVEPLFERTDRLPPAAGSATRRRARRGRRRTRIGWSMAPEPRRTRRRGGVHRRREGRAPRVRISRPSWRAVPQVLAAARASCASPIARSRSPSRASTDGVHEQEGAPRAEDVVCPEECPRGRRTRQVESRKLCSDAQVRGPRARRRPGPAWRRRGTSSTPAAAPVRPQLREPARGRGVRRHRGARSPQHRRPGDGSPLRDRGILPRLKSWSVETWARFDP
jgi:hypothetical protein